MRKALSVRARTTVVATLVVGLAIAAVSVLLVGYLQRKLIDNIDAALDRQLELAGAAINAQRPVPAGPYNMVLQMSDKDDKVISNWQTIPIHTVRLARDDLENVVVAPAKDISTAPRRTARIAVSTPEGERTIRASVSTLPVQQATETAVRSLLIGGGALLVIVAGLTWWLTGRALRPVGAIRAEFAELSAHNLHRRVPEPAVHDEVGQLAVTLNSTLDKLERWSDRQRQFVADASHELRSPISTVRTPLEVALAYPDHADWPKVATGALEDLDRLAELSADLLTLARLDDGQHDPHEPLDLGELAREVVDDRPGDVARTLESGSERIPVAGRRSQLTRLLTNLLDNADTHAERRVVVTVQREGDTAMLGVGDDGPGIPEAERERVFSRFLRLDSGRDRGSGGTGLGLAIAREIASLHNGTLTAGRADLRGALLELRIPMER